MLKLFFAKYKLIFPALFVLVLSSCSEKPISKDQALSFLKYYNGIQFADEGRQVIQTDDGGYAILGTMGSEDWNKEICLILTDEFGNLKQPIKFFGGDEDDKGKSILQAPDGGFFIGGNSLSNNNEDIYLIRTDASGDIIWDSVYVEPRDQVLKDMIISDFTNEIVITGFSEQDNGETEGYVAFFNPETGVQVKQKLIGLKTSCHSIINGNSNYLVAGLKQNTTQQRIIAAVYELPLAGSGVTPKYYEEISGNSEAISICKNGNGQYLLTCNQKLSETNSKTIVMKIANAEEKLYSIWIKEYSVESLNETKQIKVINNEIITLFNTSKSAESKNFKTVILKTSLDGTNETYYQFGENIGFAGNGFSGTLDQGLVITGLNEIDSDNKMVYLLKLNNLFKLH